jgi:putative hydrolase of the HAD superfamily
MSASYHEAAGLFDPAPRALLLDAGFTLTFYDGARIAGYAALAGVAVDGAALERVEAAFRTEIRERQGVPFRTHDDGGTGWLQRVFRRLLQLAETPGDDGVLDRAAEVILREHLAHNVWRRVGAGVRDALERLRAAGLQLAVVSNSEGNIERMFQDIGLLSLLDVVVDSAVVGLAKPDPRIFDLALSRLGISAADAIMVGDSPTADVMGARAAGIRAALLDPYGLYPWVEAPRFRDLPTFTDALLALLERDPRRVPHPPR